MATLYIGSDHAGINLREMLRDELTKLGHTVESFGPELGQKYDYPEAARIVCNKVLHNEGSFGILVCGTGIGMSMAANRVQGIRAALCGCEFQARACRQHNNANILCLGERVTGPSVALDIAKEFLSAQFEGGRHLRRIELFNNGFSCEA